MNFLRRFYSPITTLGGSTPQAVLPILESWSINICFTASTNTLKLGQQVKQNSDGTVQAAAATDFPIGVVVVAGPATYDIDTKVTVQTVFSGIGYVTADAAIAINDKLYCSGVDTNGVPKYKKCATGGTNYASAIALSAGADTTTGIKIGLLRSPILVG